MIIYVCILITFNGVKSLIDNSLNEMITRVKEIKRVEARLNHRVIIDELVEIEKSEYSDRKESLTELSKFMNSSQCK